ncbi:MAG TPA: hypothetical protein VKX41_19935 [Alloacidobacterium sp.]|nr:hypothetical protein [Alloacidobacterium sp.]
MRWLLTAFLTAGLAAAPAQRSAPMGHSGGFSGHPGNFSAPRGFAAPHINGGFNAGTHFSPAPIMAPRNFSTPPQYRPGMHARIGTQSVHLPNRYPAPSPDHHHGYHRYPYSRYRQPYLPYFYARSAYLVPGLLNDYWDYQDGWSLNDQSANFSNQEQADNTGYAEQAENSYAPEPVPAYEPQQQAQDVPPPPAPSEPLPQAAVTLVFRDGHSQQIHNYAITKTTLYVLDDAASGRRPEIALDKIDVSATERANREAGVDFAVPTGMN